MMIPLSIKKNIRCKIEKEESTATAQDLRRYQEKFPDKVSDPESKGGQIWIVLFISLQLF